MVVQKHCPLLQEQPDQLLEKMVCVGNVHKGIVTALFNAVQGTAVADGKTIGGAGRLTDSHHLSRTTMGM